MVGGTGARGPRSALAGAPRPEGVARILVSIVKEPWRIDRIESGLAE